MNPQPQNPEQALKWAQGWLRLRHRARTDLFFLANEVLSPPDSRIMVPHAHGCIVDHCQKFQGRIELFGKKGQQIRWKNGFPQLEFSVAKVPMWELEGRRDNLLLVSRGHLKALDVATPIPTPTGWKLMRDIEVGDKIFGSSGQVVTVTGVSDIKFSRDVYEVEFSTGDTVVCDGGHLWETHSKSERNRRLPPSIKTTRQIIDSLMYGKSVDYQGKANNYKTQERNHRVRVAGPIDTPDAELPIAPYTLGAWLGDGESAGARITTEDPQVLEEIAADGTPVRFTAVGNSGNVYALNGGPGHPDYYSGTGRHAEKRSVHCKLRALGVLKNKHIPAEYLRASFHQRLALLQGLMDTDGTVSKEGQCSFTNMNEPLVHQLRELILSLGLKPTRVYSWDAMLNGKSCGKCFTVAFYSYPELNPFRLKRKAERVRPRRKVSLQSHRQIVAIREVAPRFVKCIMVDSPDSLYLAGHGFIPTHNTTIHTVAHIIQWIINYPDVRVLICTATDEKAQMMVSEIKQHFQFNPRFRFLFPEICPDAKKVSDWGSKTEFTVPGRSRRTKEPTVMTASVGKALASTHHDVIKCSDVVTENNVRTQGQVQEVMDFFGYLDPLREKYDSKDGKPNPGWLDIEGTIYDYSDFYQKTLDAISAGQMDWWKVTHKSCWADRKERKPLWPERFPALQLDRILAQIGPVLFASQYELNPVSAEDGLATPQQILKFPAHILGELMPRLRIHTTVDLAGMDPQTDGDSTVFSTCGFDGDGRCYVLSIIKGRFTLDQVVNYFFAIHQIYGDKHLDFKVQKDHFSRTLWPILQREQAKRGKYLNIQLTPISTRVSKQQRIRGLQAWFMQGLIRFADNISCMNDVTLEILRFPKYEHDDILDTLADQMHNRDGHPVVDVYPDAPKWAWGGPVQDNKFLGFDPLTKEQKWLHDQIEGAHSEYSAMTGAL